MNDEAIERAALIFEGKVIDEGPQPERRADDMVLMKYYVFSVDKVWKGHVDSDRVTIYLDNYWGDTFTVGEEYLVEAYIEGRRYVSGLCGNTTYKAGAGDKIEILKMKLGTKEDNTGEE